LIVDSKYSIIAFSKQSKKWRILTGLCLGSGAIMFLGIIALFMDFKLSKLLLSFAGEIVWVTLYSCGMIAVFVTMICLSVMIECPRCKLKWFWHAMAKDPKRNIAVGHMNHCPRCNYPDEEKKDTEPAYISQKPILEVSNQKNKFRNLWRAFFAASAVMLLGIVGLVYFYRFFDLWRVCLFGGFITAFIMLVSLWISIRCLYGSKTHPYLRS
jgi:fatty acid desaturase